MLSRYTIEFMIYSFIGWLYETLLTSFYAGHYVDRGFLHLPICPIYGICALLIVFSLRRIKNPFCIFIFSAAIATAGELAASYLLEGVLGFRLWDYSEWLLNYQGRISLISSLIFGIMSTAAILYIRPLVQRLLLKYPMQTKAAAFTLSVLASADTIICLYPLVPSL